MQQTDVSQRGNDRILPLATDWETNRKVVIKLKRSRDEGIAGVFHAVEIDGSQLNIERSNLTTYVNKSSGLSVRFEIT